MLRRLGEWAASRRSRRFERYRRGREQYEAVTRELTVGFDELTDDHYERAAGDPRLLDAERCYREAVELSHADGVPTDQATALSQLGMLLHLVRRWPEAEESFQQAQRILDELARINRDQQATQSCCLYHLGLLDLKQGRLRSARQRLEASIRIDEAIGDVSGVVLGRKALARCPPDAREPAADGVPGGAPKTADIPLDDVTSADRRGFDRDGETAPPPPEGDIGLPGPFGAVTTEVLLLLALSEVDADEIRAAVREACPERRHVTLLAADFAAGTPEAPTIAPGSHLCGAILVIDRDVLTHDASGLRDWAAWCVFKVGTQTDFRLFVHLSGVHETDLEARADAGDSLMRDLLATVHLNRPESLEWFKHDLRTYLLDLDLIRDRQMWRTVRAIGVRVAGAASIIVLGATMIGWLAVWIAGFVWGREIVLSWLQARSFRPDLTGVLGGVPLFFALTLPFAFLSRGLAFANDLLRRRPSVGWWMIAGLGTANVALSVSTELHSSYSAIGAGAVWGVLLEAARRHQASRRVVLLPRAYDLVKDGNPSVPDAFFSVGGQSPMSWPVFPPEGKVFISYARKSEWSRGHAEGLHDAIHARGRGSLLDRRSIAPGSSWIRELDDQIGEALVFISVCDPLSVRRPMVAAELAAALIRRSRAGLPEIVMLKAQTLDAREIAKANGLFRRVFDLDGLQASAPRVVAFSGEETLRNIASSLGTRWETPAVFPKGVQSALQVVALPLTFLTTLAPGLGLLAFPMAVGVRLGKIDVAGWLSPPALWWFCLVCAYAFGATVRQAIGARFDGIGRRDGRAASSAIGFAAIGLALLLPSLLLRMDDAGLAWSGAATWCGWVVVVGLVQGIQAARQ